MEDDKWEDEGRREGMCWECEENRNKEEKKSVFDEDEERLKHYCETFCTKENRERLDKHILWVQLNKTSLIEHLRVIELDKEELEEYLRKKNFDASNCAAAKWFSENYGGIPSRSEMTEIMTSLSNEFFLKTSRAMRKRMQAMMYWFDIWIDEFADVLRYMVKANPSRNEGITPGKKGK